MKYDTLLFFNFFTALSAFVGTLIFIFWWVKVRKATLVYFYVLLMLFSLFLENLFEFYFRYSHYDVILTHLEEDCPFCTDSFSPYWQLKGLLVFLIVFAFTLHMGKRFFSTMAKIKKVKKNIKKHDFGNADFNVLIVEDDPQIPGVLFEYITKHCPDAKVFLKTSFEETKVFLADGNDVHMSIIDIRLKGKENGFGVVKQIKKYCPWSINIGITGYPNDYTLSEARNAGFDDYFIKPFRLGDMLSTMRFHKKKLARWKEVAGRN